MKLSSQHCPPFFNSFTDEIDSWYSSCRITLYRLNKRRKLHPLKPGRTDAPIKTLEKANSYQSVSELATDNDAVGFYIGIADLGNSD